MPDSRFLHSETVRRRSSLATHAARAGVTLIFVFVVWMCFVSGGLWESQQRTPPGLCQPRFGDLLAPMACASPWAFPLPIRVGSEDAVEASPTRKAASEPVGRHLAILEDPDSALTIETAASHVLENSYVPSEQDIPNLGRSQATFWVRFALENATAQQLTRRVLIDFGGLEELDIYVAEDGGFTRHARGLHYPEAGFYPRFDIPNSHVDVTLPPGAVKTVYMRVRSPHAVVLPMYVGTPAAIEARQHARSTFAAFYFGIMFALLTYNLFLFASTRDRGYLAYVAYLCVFHIALLFQITGLSYSIFFHDKVEWLQVSITLTVAASVVAMLMFISRFLDLKNELPWMATVFNILSGLALCSFALNTVVGDSLYSAFIEFNNTLLFLSSLVITGTVVVLLSRRSRHALAFAPAWACMVIGGGLYFFKLKAMLPSNLLTDNAIVFGAAGEAIFLSLSLGNRINQLRREKLEIELRERKNRKFKTLVHILCHDLVNHIMVIFVQAEERLGIVSGEPLTEEECAALRLASPGTGPAATEEERNAWRKVYRSVQDQLDLLGLVRKLDAIEDESNEVELSPVKLVDAIEECLKVFEHRLSEKGISVIRSYPDDAGPCAVLAEPVSLKSNVINNLLSNAIKFSFPSSFIEVSVTRVDGRVRFEVRDFGIGMSEAVVRTLFSSDFPKARWGTRGEKGSGFGFQLIRYTLARFGASIALESHERAAQDLERVGMPPPGTRMVIDFKEVPLLA